MVNNSGSEKDRLKAWQILYFGCCLASADCGGGVGWAADVLAVRRWLLEAADAGVSTGKNCCGVSICW